MRPPTNARNRVNSFLLKWNSKSSLHKTPFFVQNSPLYADWFLPFQASFQESQKDRLSLYLFCFISASKPAWRFPSFWTLQASLKPIHNHLFRSNILGVDSVLQVCRTCSLRKFISSPTTACYGAGEWWCGRIKLFTAGWSSSHRE